MPTTPSPRGLTARRCTATAVAALIVASGALVASPVTAAPATSAAPAAPLISTGSTEWSYLDNNVDPSPTAGDTLAWTGDDYDDSSWKSALGSFGAKSGGKTGMGGGHTVNTLLNHYINGTGGTTVPTYFFRTTFDLTEGELADIRSLQGTATFDDAMIVYVNEKKVAGFEDAGITQNLQYGGDAGSDPSTGSISVPQSDLKVGENTVAVALHQVNATSSDIYFDFTELNVVSKSVAAQISDVNLNVGSDQYEHNLAWYTNSGVDEDAQLVLKSAATGDEFPADAKSFAASGGTATDGQTYQRATMTGLVPNTDYLYRVGSDERGWSPTYGFSTGALEGDYAFLYAGDAQVGASGNLANDRAGWIDTLQKADTMFPDSSFLLSAGDQVESAPNEAEYDAFLSPDLLREIPLATNNGNHDVASLAYEQHFNMPNVDKNYGAGVNGWSGGNYWYMYNDTLYIALNSNNRDDANHAEYVEKIVAEQGDKAKWKVVTFHHSIYSVASHATDADIIQRRASLPPVFSKMGIDLVLMGHDHVYTRSHLMQGTEATDTEAAGTVIPEDGEVLYLTANSASGSKYYSIRDQAFPWSAVQNQERVPNFTNIEVTDEAITATTYRSTDLTVVDEVRLQAPVVEVPPTEPTPEPTPEPTTPPTTEPTPEPTTPPTTEPTPEPTTPPTTEPTPEPTPAPGTPEAVPESSLVTATKTLDIVDVDRATGTISVNVGAANGNTPLSFYFYSTPVFGGTLTASASGDLTITVPSSLPAGAHKLAALDADGTVVSWNSFSWAAVDGGGAAGDGSLAATGFENGWLLGVGGLVLAAGALLVLMARRQKRTAE